MFRVRVGVMVRIRVRVWWGLAMVRGRYGEE